MREPEPFFIKPIQASRKRGVEGGFTFIELAAVIAILSILAALIVPKYSSGGFRAQSGAYVVASDIMSARMEAMVTSTPVTVGFSPGNALYSFGVDRVRDLSNLEGRLFIETGDAVTFNSLGEPIGLTARRSVTVSDGTSRAILFIEPYTGLVTVQ